MTGSGSLTDAGSEEMSEKSSIDHETDVAVVGGGILGLCTALNLLQAGREVLILERGAPWREASGVNAGSLAIQIMREPIVPFAAESIRLWRKFHDELPRGVGYTPVGGLRVASSESEATDLRAAIATLRSYGVEAEWLGDSEVHRFAPWLGRNICGASYCTAEGYGSPLLAGRVLTAAVSKAGGTVIRDAAVRAITPAAAGFVLQTDTTRVRCQVVIIASGAWSARVAALVGVKFSLRLMINMLTITEAAAPIMNRLVTHAQRNLTLKQYPNGTCIVGGGWQGRGSLDTGRKDVDFPTLARNYVHAIGVVPGLGKVKITRMWAGFEGTTADEYPLFGRLPGQRNAYIIGCVRGGYTLGPFLGQLMAELVVRGVTSRSVTAFAPERPSASVERTGAAE